MLKFKLEYVHKKKKKKEKLLEPIYYYAISVEHQVYSKNACDLSSLTCTYGTQESLEKPTEHYSFFPLRFNLSLSHNRRE